MAKKSAVNRNEMVRKLVKQFAAKRKALKDTAENEALSAGRAFRRPAEAGGSCRATRRPAASATAARSPAVPRAFYRKLKMSRIALRDLGSSGQIPGLVKSSW